VSLTHYGWVTYDTSFEDNIPIIQLEVAFDSYLRTGISVGTRYVFVEFGILFGGYADYNSLFGPARKRLFHLQSRELDYG
jgi:hypothetical protein